MNYTDYFTYAELRVKALAEHIPDNKTEIGIWIKMNRYRRVRKQFNNERKYYYYYEN